MQRCIKLLESVSALTEKSDFWLYFIYVASFAPKTLPQRPYSVRTQHPYLKIIFSSKEVMTRVNMQILSIYAGRSLRNLGNQSFEPVDSHHFQCWTWLVLVFFFSVVATNLIHFYFTTSLLKRSRLCGKLLNNTEQNQFFWVCKNKPLLQTTALTKILITNLLKPF